VLGAGGPWGFGVGLPLQAPRLARFFDQIMGAANPQAHPQVQGGGDFNFFDMAGVQAINLPGQMDYARAPFEERAPQHEPPPPAQEGFTRSPVEGDMVICPSCDEELIHRKDTPDEVVIKKGKAPTRKEREEHPFWVLKECGHVCLSHLLLVSLLKFPRFTVISATKTVPLLSRRQPQVLLLIQRASRLFPWAQKCRGGDVLSTTAGPK